MNILLLDGGKDFGHSHGELNHTLHKKAKEVLTILGHNVQETVIDAGYDVEAEIEKFLWMDAVIWQMPGWWMHEPWTVKKYIDEVLTAGHGKLYHSDGRHRVNPTEGYGTGGLLQGKKHMLSLTWNAPIEAFTREGDFFEGKGVDALYMHFHKLNEFIGLTPLPPLFLSVGARPGVAGVLGVNVLRVQACSTHQPRLHHNEFNIARVREVLHVLTAPGVHPGRHDPTIGATVSDGVDPHDHVSTARW